MKNIICCRAYHACYNMRVRSLLKLVVEFALISTLWQASKHYYSEVHSVWGKCHQNTPFLSLTQTHVSSFEAARPQQGHWAIVAMADWKYRAPIRKTSRSERPNLTLCHVKSWRWTTGVRIGYSRNYCELNIKELSHPNEDLFLFYTHGFLFIVRDGWDGTRAAFTRSSLERGGKLH